MKNSALGAVVASAVLAATGYPACSADWSGVYAGFGGSFTDHEVAFPNGTDHVRMSDTTAPGIAEYDNTSGTLDQSGHSAGGHVLGGIRFQVNKFVFGAEADYEIGSKFDSPAPAGTPACQNPPVPTTGNFGCVGLGVYFSDVKTLGHVRATAGVEVTPNMLAYFAGGLAIGKSPDSISARASGMVASSPSAPLVGQATVTRAGIGKTVYGYTLGGGVEVKAGGGMSLRTEYIYDHFNGQDIAVGGAGFGGTIGELTTNSFASPGDRINYSSQAIRISAIYQFNDDEPLPAYVTESDWGGFYVGGGVSMARHRVGFVDSTNILRLTNNLTSTTREYTPSSIYDGDSIGGHLLAGYAHQFGRFVVGGEGDIEIGSTFSRDSTHIMAYYGDTIAGPECLNGPSATPDTGIPSGHFGCVGTRLNFGEVKNYGHVRFKAGYEVTPALLAFATGGIAIGRSPDYYSASVLGFMASSPSAPLVGAATVQRNNLADTVIGFSIGGGVEVKASEHLRLRTEYVYDNYGTVEHKPVGGAGFGGTIGDLTTNSFVSPGTKIDLSSQTVRLSAIYQF